MSRAEPPTNCCSARSMDVLCRRINVTSRVVNPCGLGSCCRSWHEWAAVTLPDCLTHSLRSPCTFFRQRKRTGARCFPCFGIGKRFTLVRKFVTSRIAETCGILPKSMASCLLVWCVSRKGIEAAGVVPVRFECHERSSAPNRVGLGDEPAAEPASSKLKRSSVRWDRSCSFRLIRAVPGNRSEWAPAIAEHGRSNSCRHGEVRCAGRPGSSMHDAQLPIAKPSTPPAHPPPDSVRFAAARALSVQRCLTSCRLPKC
jgi:hypothetical protein